MGAQISPGLLHVPTISPTHVPAVVLHSGGDTGGFTTLGAQPLSITVSGAISIEYAQGDPPQSLPAGTALTAVHAPVQAGGGSNDVGVPVQRAWLSAVIVAGNPHDPAAGSHAQAPHVIGGTVRSA